MKEILSLKVLLEPKAKVSLRQESCTGVVRKQTSAKYKEEIKKKYIMVLQALLLLNKVPNSYYPEIIKIIIPKLRHFMFC